ALQKHLKSRLTTAGATNARFFYACPLALFYLWGLSHWGGLSMPEANAKFLIYCILGGATQILATSLMVWMFSFRNFAVGTTYSKTEIVQVAFLGLILLGDTLTLGAVIAIAISLVGIMAMSVAQTKITLFSLFRGLTEKPTLIGLASGVFLGASVVLFRGASLSLNHDSAIMAAAFALAVAVSMQTVAMGIYLRFREPGTFGAVLRNWRWASAVGVAGVLGSICWFTAFTLQNAAYVRALGQIELVFTFIASIFFFKEKVTRLEFFGIISIVVGIMIVVLVE
ncbi:MAG: EamA family transporter, partial [Alphaproteobacteria bacterium]|nr:EamA family transporter [Alphaproteobacteria bacterium]